MRNDRRCSACGCYMAEGFCINDGEAYYCSEECLHTAYTEGEYNEMYRANEAYWTEWESGYD